MSSTHPVISHWSTLIEGYQLDSKRFYQSVIDNIKQRQIPSAQFRVVSLREGNLFSTKRDYLRVDVKEDYYFVICGAHFGTASFISWRLLQKPDGCMISLLSPWPILSGLTKFLIRPWTFYRMDTVSMFQTATHQSVVQVVDQIVSGTGNELSELDRKPVNEMYFQK